MVKTFLGMVDEFSDKSRRNPKFSVNFGKMFLSKSVKNMSWRTFLNMTVDLWKISFINRSGYFARATPRLTSPKSFHTALASLGCMKDLGLVNSGMVLASSYLVTTFLFCLNLVDLTTCIV